MRYSTRLFATLLHAFCVLALAISCGTPEALHDLGHAISQTACESSLPAAPNSVTSTADTCWIQSLVGSVSQFSARTSNAPQIAELAPQTQIAAPVPTQAFVTHDWVSWHTSRGPPVV